MTNTNDLTRKMSLWTDRKDNIIFWVGRAKLPHVGHIKYLKFLWDKGYKLLIGNGSAYTMDPRNPIHVFQVKAMLGVSLIQAGIPEEDFTFVPIPDFSYDKKWVDYISKIPCFEVVDTIATGNPHVVDAFNKHLEGSDELVVIPETEIRKENNISATRLREAIRDNEFHIWYHYAAYGTKIFAAHVGGFGRLRERILGNERPFHPGRQAADLATFVFDGFEWQVVVGTRTKSDFAGMLAIPGGGIEYYEFPPEAALREFTEETGIPVKISFPWSLPTEIVFGDTSPKMSHLHFVGMYSTQNEEFGGTSGGSSLCFMTVFEGSKRELEYSINPKGDLVNVRIEPVRKVLQEGLAFQQTDMLKDAFSLLEKIRT